MKLVRIFTLFFLSAVVVSAATAQSYSFANLAVLVAKGYFKDYVRQDAPLEECVHFLNSRGVCFSLFDVMDEAAAVTKEDVARAVGQSTLLFLGEAELESGCIKRPLDAESWVDYCLLNDVGLDAVFSGFVARNAKGPLPEVRKFFGGGL